jgi:predicted PurR-regulated permease PerM
MLSLTLSATLALGWIVLPFYGSILWGAVIALTFAPLNRHLLPRTGGRPSLAAMLTLLVAVLLGVLPLALVVALLASEATTVYTRLQSGEWQPAAYLRHLFHALPESVITWLGRMGWGDFDTVQQHVTSGLTRASRFFAGQALGMGQDTVRFVTGVFIALYLAFFLIRDGQALARAARLSMPLAADHQRELLDKFGTVIRATVKGNLLVAALHGLLGGLAFWALGVSAPLLWGVSMAFLSLVPAVGAALVWAPVALYFLLAGATWKAVMLTVFGVLVIGLIDNLLRGQPHPPGNLRHIHCCTVMEFGSHITGAHRGHVHPRPGTLPIQAFRENRHPRFGSRVGARRDPGGDAAHVDDGARTAFTHARKSCVTQFHDRSHHHIEDSSRPLCIYSHRNKHGVRDDAMILANLDVRGIDKQVRHLNINPTRPEGLNMFVE